VDVAKPRPPSTPKNERKSPRMPSNSSGRLRLTALTEAEEMLAGLTF
jgi:hypothetical protein